MKLIFISLAVLAIGASAEFEVQPTKAEARFVDGIIRDQIRKIQQEIRDRGLDPLEMPKEYFYYKVPVTDLFFVEALLEDLLVVGLSDIRINNLDFSLLSRRLRFDLSLPNIFASVGAAKAQSALGHWYVSGSLRGSVEVSEIRVSGEVRVNVGIISGVSISRLDIDFRVGLIQSNLELHLLDHDFSNHINHVIGRAIPDFLNEFRSDINKVLEFYARQIAEEFL